MRGDGDAESGERPGEIGFEIHLDRRPRASGDPYAVSSQFRKARATHNICFAIIEILGVMGPRLRGDDRKGGAQIK